MTQPLLELRESSSHPWLVLAAEGELDLLTGPRLAVRVREHARHGARAVCLDLTGVTFVDSAGLAALVNAARAMARCDGELRVVAQAGSRLEEMLRLGALGRVLPLSDRVPVAA